MELFLTITLILSLSIFTYQLYCYIQYVRAKAPSMLNDPAEKVNKACTV